MSCCECERNETGCSACAENNKPIDWRKPVGLFNTLSIDGSGVLVKVACQGDSQVCLRLSSGSLMLVNALSGWCEEAAFRHFKAKNIPQEKWVNIYIALSGHAHVGGGNNLKTIFDSEQEAKESAFVGATSHLVKTVRVE